MNFGNESILLIEIIIFILIWSVFLFLIFKYTKQIIPTRLLHNSDIISFVISSFIIAHMFLLGYKYYYKLSFTLEQGLPHSCSNTYLEYFGFRKCSKYEDVVSRNILWSLSPLNVVISMFMEYIYEIFKNFVNIILLFFNSFTFWQSFMIFFGFIFFVVPLLIFCKFNYSFFFVYGLLSIRNNEIQKQSDVKLLPIPPPRHSSLMKK